MTCAMTEALVVGVFAVVFGNLVWYALKKTSLNVNSTKECNDWNKNNIKEISLFLTGFIGHIFFELVGVNSWYCKNGSACGI